MTFIFVTLNTAHEARAIGRSLLERRLANCVNFFPITEDRPESPYFQARDE